MSTIRCPHCNLVNWATAPECKRCRAALQNNSAAFEQAPVGGFQTSPNQLAQPTFSNQSYQQSVYQQPVAFNAPPQSAYNQPNNNYGGNAYQPNYQYNQLPSLKNGLAIASMVLGILAFVSSIFLVGLLLAPFGLILGIVALVKASRKPFEYGGKGFAVTGVVLSSLVALLIPIIAAIAIPNLLAARRAANEGSAISSVRMLWGATATYQEIHQAANTCPTMQKLGAEQLISPELADGEKNGYRFAIQSVAGACEITATPTTVSNGTRSFFYSTLDGKLRGASKQGAPATRSDPVIN